MRLTEEDIKKRRETVVYHAFQLFCKKGIESVKLVEIAKKSQIGVATIYRYFGNKELLVLEAFLKMWDEMMGSVHKSVEDTPDYEKLTGYEQIKLWIESFRYLYQKGENFVLFSYEAKLYFVRHGMKLDKEQQEGLMYTFRGPCMAAIDKGKADGSIPVKESSEDIFYAIWGAIRGYVVKIVMYKKLNGENSPWESRYQTLENGILSSLDSGWNPPS